MGNTGRMSGQMLQSIPQTEAQKGKKDVAMKRTPSLQKEQLCQRF